MKYIISLILIFCLPANVLADGKAEAREPGIKANPKMNDGSTSDALILSVKSANPASSNSSYEIASAHYLNKNYKTAIDILNNLITNHNINAQIYQMLGNCYNLVGDQEKAIEIYDKALSVFPRSGRLYLERGNIEFHKQQYYNALQYYETGIEVNPMFAANYYWAAKIYLNSHEEVWGMIYGEIFMNIERNSELTFEISEKLYNTYKSQIQFKVGNRISVSFSKEEPLNLKPYNQNKTRTSFGVGVYETTLLLAAIMENRVDLFSLNRIRARFIDLYMRKEYAKDYQTVLFDYQKKIIDAGHFEAYNHWILIKGDENLFAEWRRKNWEKWLGFMDWYSKNPIEINDSNKFFREKYSPGRLIHKSQTEIAGN